jgi:uroporphyrinogen decarboxylase
MNSRERVIAAIEFKGPDRIPHRHRYIPSSFTTYPQLRELYAEYPSDFAGDDGKGPGKLSREYLVGGYVDEWDCEWTVAIEGQIGQVTGHPLAELGNLGKYRFPHAKDAPHWNTAKAIAANRGDKYVCLGWMTMFERMTDLCGYENLLTELILGNPDILKIRDCVVDHNIEVVKELLKLNPDGIYFADDWGTQISLQISPAMWREVFAPAYRRQFLPVKEAGKHVFFHTDGYTIDILPDLVDAGVDVFWADLTVNPIERLHDELGGKVCFEGLTDVQFILRNGSMEEIAMHGMDMMAALGSFDGGFIACHEIASDQPYENIRNILQTFNDYAEYPLSIKWNGDKTTCKSRGCVPV